MLGSVLSHEARVCAASFVVYGARSEPIASTLDLTVAVELLDEGGVPVDSEW
jgi:hypothetical protein